MSAFLALALHASAQDQTVSGNLTVTGTANVSQLVASGGSIQMPGNAGLVATGAPSLANVAGFGLEISTLQFGIATNGGSTPNFVIDSHGNVGIGSPSPAQALDVNGNMLLRGGNFYIPANHAFNFYDLTNEIPLLAVHGTAGYAGRIDMTGPGDSGTAVSINAGGPSYFNGGSVGIGTSSPGTRLTVSGGWDDGISIIANNPQLVFNHLGAVTNFARITADSGVSANYNGLWLASNETRDGVQANTSLSSWAVDLGGTDMTLNDSFNIRRKPAGGAYTIPFVINAAGNVGIGTESPQASLDVAGQGRFNRTAVQLPVNGYGSLVVTGNEGISLLGTGAAPTTPGSDLNLAPNSGYAQGVMANWYYSTGDTYTRDGGAAGILFHTQTLGGFGAGDITFHTAPPGTAGTVFGFATPLVIKQGGNVGIGTTIPQEKLEVAGYIGVPANAGEYMPSTWNRGNAGGIIFASAANPDGTGWAYGSRIVNNDYGDGLGLSFDALYATNWINDALFISGRSGRVGNIGIGTTSPSAKLEVNGDAKIDGNLTVSGNFSAPGYVASTGTITGGSNGLTLNAGGTNQNVTISPTGTGVTVLNGSVGIGTATPQDPLHVYTSNTGGMSITAGTGSGGNENIFAGGHDLAMYAMNYTGGLALSQTANNVGLIQEFTSSGTKGAGAQSENGTLLLNPGGGNVGIGTVSPDTALTVKGRVHATEVVVDTTIAAADLKVQPKAWADDVFADGRKLVPLSQVEKEIKADKHLPGIPSAKEVATDGVSVSEMQTKLLAQVEELTLRMIEQEKRIEKLEAENAALRQK